MNKVATFNSYNLWQKRKVSAWTTTNLKSNLAKDIKISAGREKYETKVLSPLDSVSDMMLLLPAMYL